MGNTFRLEPRGVYVSTPGGNFMGEISGGVDSRYLMNVMTAACGHVTHAAALVGKERRAFGKLLKKYGIGKAEYVRQAR